MSTFSPSLRIELITTGDQAGVWGNTTNTNLGTLVESAIAGYVSVSVIAADQALTAINGAEDQSRNQVIALTTTTVAAFNVYAPPAEKTYTIYNASAYAATLYNSTVLGNTTAAGAGAIIPAGKTVTLWSDGTNFVFQNNHLASLTLATDLAIADGGTGASTAANARTNLGLVIGTDVPSPTGTGSSGTWPININGNAANATIAAAALTANNVTGIVAVANGGTGASTAANARTNLGLVIGTNVPSPTGTGASGTWAINITGNAATATNATSATNATNSVNATTSTTQPFGTNNTAIATTAFVQAALQALHPVGSVYINATNGTNPASLLGFGAWAAFGAGRVPVGFDAGNALFNSAEQTGGGYDATLVSHTHTGSTGGQSATHSHSASTSISDPGHRHRIAGGVGGAVAVLGTQSGTVAGIGAGTSGGYVDTYNGVPIIENSTTGISASTSIGNASNDHSHSFTTASSGSSATNANIQPYITVFMWKRIA